MLGLPRRPWAESEAYAMRRLRGSDWMKMRDVVFREEERCYLCGSLAASTDSLDHVLAVVHGGTDERSNLRRCCRECHKAKSATERPKARR